MLPDRDLLGKLSGLARQMPLAAETADALFKVHARLLREAERQRGARTRWIVRLAIPASIAACLIVGALLWLRPSPNAIALRDFRAATSTAERYTGWIHVAAVVHGGSSETHIDYRENAGEGLFGIARNTGNDTQVTFYSLQQGILESYRNVFAQSGFVRRRAANPDDVTALQSEILLPAAIGEALKMARDMTGHEADIRGGRAPEPQRYDVSLFRPDDEVHALLLQRGGAVEVNMPAAFSVWLSGDRSISRLDFVGPSGPVSEEISYGGPGITGIFDLGVPRDARVIDERAGTSRPSEPGERGAGGPETNEHEQQEHEQPQREQQEHESGERGRD